MSRRGFALRTVVAGGFVAGLAATTIFAGGEGSDVSAPATPALAAPAGVQSSAAWQSRGAPPPIARQAVGAISPPLRSLPRVTQPAAASAEPPERELNLPPGPENEDPVVQRSLGANAMPAPLLSWEGITNNDNWTILGRSARPPDNAGEMGQNHYVEWVNALIEVFDRSGTTVSGPVAGNSLFVNLPGTTDVCETTNRGDPLVHYDQLADRWVLSQFAFASDPTTGALLPPYKECLAVSTSNDPTGTYCTYSLTVSNVAFDDYPKMGVWPDGYYFSFNMFTGGTTYAGPAAMAVDRQDTLSCAATADYLVFEPANTPALSNQPPFLPSDLDGPTSPPAGSPNYFVGLNSSNNGLLLRKFAVNWTTNTGTFTGPTAIPVAPFDTDICAAARETCIPQKDTPNQLEAISDRVMMRLAYRNFDTHESLVVNHTVDAGSGRAGVRWYELRNPNGTPTAFQQSTFAPADGEHRWMGSAAQDRVGNLAVGYSISSTARYPSIRYAGRLVTDPPSTLAQGEATMFDGVAPAPVTAFPGGDPRWGDYTHLVTDPVDDCTFWYINETQSDQPLSDGSFRRWATRIGSFKFETCSPPTAVAVRSFAARWQSKRIAVRWRTASEVEILGFNVYRSIGAAPFRKANRTLITAKGGARGFAYRFVDRAVKRGKAYTYRLQVVERGGKRSWYGAGSAASG